MIIPSKMNYRTPNSRDKEFRDYLIRHIMELEYYMRDRPEHRKEMKYMRDASLDMLDKLNVPEQSTNQQSKIA